MTGSITVTEFMGTPVVVPRKSYNFFEWNPNNAKWPITVQIFSINGDSITFQLPFLDLTGKTYDTGANFPDVAPGYGGSTPTCTQCSAPYINNGQTDFWTDSLFPQQTGQWVPLTSAAWMMYSSAITAVSSPTPYAGSRCGQISLTAWDMIHFGCNVYHPKAQVTSFQFAARTASGTGQLYIWFGSSTHRTLTPAATSTGWTLYTVPIAADSSIGTTFNDISIQNDRTAVTYYIDEMKFNFAPSSDQCTPWITPTGGVTCSGLPSITNAGAGNCVAGASSGTTCTPTCNTGFTGTLSATCTTGTWSTTGSCTSTSCSTAPSIANSATGTCTLPVSSGTTCAPACTTGYTGTLSATCTTGTWSTTGSCTSTSCSTAPSIANSVTGTCALPVSSGTTCAPACASGYTGTLSATCAAGTWSTTGSCTSTRCTTAPSIANSITGTCTLPVNSGTTCAPACASGYTGTLSATCNNAVWTTTGSCSASCTTAPVIANSITGTCNLPVSSGTTCAPACASGFTGTLSATCTAGTWSTTGSCTSTSCATAPSIANSVTGTCTLPVSNGATCAPACTTGYTGTLSATCTAGTWSTTGSCTSTSCPTAPSIPNSVTGTCTLPVSSGTTCAPGCATGYTGTLSATCNSGTWSTAGACTSTTCPTSPLITNSVTGTCTLPMSSGTTCSPACATGYTGTLSATCNSGTWSTTGSCTSTACTGLPPISNSGAGNCVSGASSGTICTPVCLSGYTGTLSATCSNAVWSSTGTCTSTSCSGLPLIANSGAGTCVANSATGTTCTPTCNSGYMGTLSATCNLGSWTTSGMCTSTACAGTPSLTNGGIGNCVAGSASGTTCTPTCNSGYMGTISATCFNAVWSITGTCSTTSCTTLPSITNAGAGNCVSDAASGSSCVPTCISGYTGTLSATCTNGVWSTTGSCTSSACAGTPSLLNAGPGNCIAGSATGYTCVPTCSSGYTGSLTATCNMGTWTSTGTCTSTACAGLPSITNAGPGNCVSDAASGSTCTPVCNSGYAGTLSASCSNAVWTHSGSCTSTACSSPPVIPNAATGDCLVNSASGTTCTPICNSGYSGTLSASCTNSAWAVSGSCIAQCTALPSVANAGVGDCTVPANSGTSCTPVCQSGYTGIINAACTNGAFVVTGICSPNSCTGTPTILNAGAGDCVAPTTSGTTCTPACSTGYSGTLSATCTAGSWTTSGACALVGGLPCTALPSIPNSDPGTCSAPLASGTTCTPTCQARSFGTLSATCSSGTWSTTGSCASSDCQTAVFVQNGDVGDCSTNVLTGTTCTPVCSSGYSGTLSASCSNGAWTVTGTCIANLCNSLPAIPNALAGNCVVGSADGTTCTPVCATGFTGTLSATCSNTAWTTTGNCITTSCFGLPTITNGNTGDCVSGAASGSTCAPVCSTGYTGTLSASCANTVWTVTGTCTGLPCTTAPAIANSGAGDCTNPALDGTTCHPVCNSGYTGVPSATCNLGVWTVSGLCASTAGPDCTTLPTLPPSSSQGNCAANVPSGSTCVPVCDTSFTGTLLATCDAGVWSVSGSCSTTACSLPTIQDSVPGDCAPVTPSGGSCSPQCAPGFTGTLFATCQNTVWSSMGSCVPVPPVVCSSLPSVPNAVEGDCVIPASDGFTCTPACASGFTGTLSAACSAGTWTIVGECSQSSPPPPASCSLSLLQITNAEVGDCTDPQPSGTTCHPTCNTQFTGTLSASCLDGLWSTSGTCTATPATGDPTYHVTATAKIDTTCDDVRRNALDRLNAYLEDYYKDKNCHLPMFVSECDEHNKRAVNSDIVLEGDLTGSGATAEYQMAESVVEGFFSQSNYTVTNLQVTVTASEETGSGLPPGACAGIIVGVILAVLLVLLLVFALWYRKKGGFEMV